MTEPSPENIKKIFDHYFPVEIRFWNTFSKLITVRKFERNETIKKSGGVENYINILASGSVAHFVPNNGKEICINLYYENEIFSEYLSFLNQKPSIIKTEALEDCVLWALSFENLQALYGQSAESLAIGKAISEIMFTKKQNEQVNLLTLSPTERYLKLIKERPQIFQRTPLKIISTYLGIAPESLSRIRKKIS